MGELLDSERLNFLSFKDKKKLNQELCPEYIFTIKCMIEMGLRSLYISHPLKVHKIEGLSHSILGAHPTFQIAPQVIEMNQLHEKCDNTH